MPAVQKSVRPRRKPGLFVCLNRMSFTHSFERFTLSLSESSIADSGAFFEALRFFPRRYDGTDRMIKALNTCGQGSPEEILRAVRSAVDAFAGDAGQFDDLTMMCLEYRGPEETGEEQA